MCHCSEQPKLIDISHEYSEFKSSLLKIAEGNWVFLMKCPECNQLWRVDEWDKYQTLYAVKLSSESEWENHDISELIKARIIEKRGGITQEKCIWSGCNFKQVKGSAYCVNHFYETGARA